MPKDKDPNKRYQIINRLLNLRKGQTSIVGTDDLLNACEIGVRQLRKDIDRMKSLGAPIVYSRKLGGYRYSEPFDITTDLALNSDDIARLKVAANTLAQFRHLEIFSGLSDTIEKIEKSVERWVRSSPSSKSIYFQPIPYYRGTEHIPILLRSVEQKQVIEFDYQSFKSPEVRRHTLHPYFLQEFSNRWYIVGWLPEFNSITPFALERIVGEVESLKIYFDTPANFTPEHYFENTYGMTHYSDAYVEEIILSFTISQSKYFISKPFHKYQILSEDSNAVIIRMNLVINYELIRIIVGMGDGVKVLAPHSLINKVKEFHSDALSQYV